MSLFHILSIYYPADELKQYNEYSQSLNTLWINTKTNEQFSIYYDYNKNIFLKNQQIYNLYILYEKLTNDIIIFMPLIKNQVLNINIPWLDYYPPWIIKIFENFDLNNIQKDIQCTILIRWRFFLNDNPWYRYKNYVKTGLIPYTDEILINIINFREKYREYLIQLKGAKNYQELLIYN